MWMTSIVSSRWLLSVGQEYPAQYDNSKGTYRWRAQSAACPGWARCAGCLRWRGWGCAYYARYWRHSQTTTWSPSSLPSLCSCGGPRGRRYISTLRSRDTPHQHQPVDWCRSPPPPPPPSPSLLVLMLGTRRIVKVTKYLVNLVDNIDTWWSLRYTNCTV